MSAKPDFQSVESAEPTLREIRQEAGWPLTRAAVEAGVSEPTARLYEACPSAVVSPKKRAALAGVYQRLRAMLKGAA